MVTESKSVLVVGEIAEGKLAPVVAECLAAARNISAVSKEEVIAVLLGADLDAFPQELVAAGADKVFLVENALLENYQTDLYISALQQVCQQVKPDVLLMGQTVQARDLLPRLAFRLGAGLAMDCLELSVDASTGVLKETRPIYGGIAMATFTCPSARPQMASIRPKAVSPMPPDPSRKGEIISLEVNLDPSIAKVQVIETIKQQAEGKRLEDADVVISGGRGLGGPENFKYIEELATALKGVVGASRAVCDLGWIDPGHQVGLTGKVVTPSLYIAVGISGASQHMAGCSGAKVIVAINKDPDAHIFKEAQYGIVGDWKQVLPSFTEMCKELIGS